MPLEYAQLKVKLDAQSLDEIRATPTWEECRQICALTETSREMLRGNSESDIRWRLNTK